MHLYSLKVNVRLDASIFCQVAALGITSSALFVAPLAITLLSCWNVAPPIDESVSSRPIRIGIYPYCCSYSSRDGIDFTAISFRTLRTLYLMS